MKRLLLPCLGLLLPALSQAQANPHLRLGLTAGGTLTTLVGPGTRSEPEVQPLGGVVGGVMAQLPLTAKGHLFLQSELVYNQEGNRLTHPSTNYSATLRSNYVTLPLLLGFTTHGFFALAGPQVGYLAGGQHRYQFDSYAANGTYLGPAEGTDTDIRGYQRWEASLTGAVGYRLSNGLGLEVRYAEALNSFRGDSYSDNIRSRNAGGQVRLSYLFHY